MPIYSAPPPLPWIPTPESASRPLRAWLPADNGASFREVLRGDHAAITGTAAWGQGSYGRCFAGNGSSFGVSGTFASTDALSVTVVHISGSNPYRGLVGWGSNFQGILYSGPRISLIDSGTAERFSANLTAPTASWRVITLTLAGHAIGSAGEFWVDGVRVSSGVISSAAGSLSPATQFWIGAVRGGTNPWQAGIGPVYLHDRILSAKEIAALHADPWRVLRDFRSPVPRRLASIPPPQILAGAGGIAPVQASGSLLYYRTIGGTGVIAPAGAAGSLQDYQELSGTGILAPVEAAGSVGTVQLLSGIGQIAPVGASGEILEVSPEIVASIVSHVRRTPALIGSVSGIRWEEAREKVPAPYATIREISSRWLPHAEAAGSDSYLIEIKLTARTAALAKALAVQWTRGPSGLDYAEIPIAGGSVLTLMRENAPLLLPPLPSTDQQGNQLRAAVVEYRAIIER